MHTRMKGFVFENEKWYYVFVALKKMLNYDDYFSYCTYTNFVFIIHLDYSYDNFAIKF